MKPRRRPLRRKVRVKPINAKRRAANFLKQFDSPEFVAFVHGLGCSVIGCERGQIQAAHVVHSRGAGGRAEHITGLCSYHHLLQGSMGIQTFQEVFGVDLVAAARQTWAEWQRMKPVAQKHSEDV